MKTGSRGMGSKKHGQSGHCGKSPKLRQHLKREAEKNDRPEKKTTTEFKETFKDLFDT